ncbi:MAG: hypothetical protein ACYS8I_16930, partial [Planctomycetota bacterium]
VTRAFPCVFAGHIHHPQGSASLRLEAATRRPGYFHAHMGFATAKMRFSSRGSPDAIVSHMAPGASVRRHTWIIRCRRNLR